MKVHDFRQFLSWTTAKCSFSAPCRIPLAHRHGGRPSALGDDIRDAGRQRHVLCARTFECARSGFTVEKLKSRGGFAGEDRAELLKVERMLRSFAATEK
jgi:hypothetical protein